ncbi:IclR family transcriptional regulator C-terminal domain-containing protein [Amycolatopsis sp. PS_44_ISF1]|uniref:IclR family transcriptional regulator n=1 Tax=Amycolatopsis sp. PS_44_ISF1 TaxID=2974917 RepID=UPI0028E0501E|nr:IclR family transcriptional regulator C-terminal domain-containing protein [Amycolatopsis sp. PS_44_ISF1]MDT8909805.1 helix-turn-helix domain-containing protein [Amycolatopsis sp. PS_44_ISF1]
MGSSRQHHRTVDRVAAILESVASSASGLTLTQLAARLDAPVSSVQKLVNGLAAVGYLDEEDRHFVLGPAPHVLTVRSGRVPARSVSPASLTGLAQASDCAALLAVQVGDSAVYVDWAGTDEPFDYALSRSLRSALPRTAAGRILLASLPEPARRAAVAHECGPDTRAGVQLLTALSTVRAQGYALLDSGHVMETMAAVAVPVVEAGRVVAALALAAPSEVVQGRLSELVGLLRNRD